MYKGLVHFHSCYSYDSVTSIASIVSFAEKNELNFLILTDHDSIKGSIALKNYIEEANINLEIIVGAEYKTDCGDIIAIGIDSEIFNMDFDIFVQDVKRQGGITLFPHPYVGHKNIEYIAEKVDMIEVFNSRVSDDLNFKATILANKYKKNTYFSSDAHLLFDLGNSIVEFKKNGDLINSILTSNMIKISEKKTKYLSVILSQLIKSVKKKDFNLFTSNIYLLIRKFNLLWSKV